MDGMNKAGSYEITWEARGVVKRHYGHLTARDLLGAARTVGSSQHFDQLRYIINDFSAVTSHEIDRSAIEEFASARIGAAFNNPWVLSPFVAPGEPGRWLAEHLLNPQLANRHPTRIFDSMAAARAWLATAGPEVFA